MQVPYQCRASAVPVEYRPSTSAVQAQYQSRARGVPVKCQDPSKSDLGAHTSGRNSGRPSLRTLRRSRAILRPAPSGPPMQLAPNRAQGRNDVGQCDLPEADDDVFYCQVAAGSDHTVLLRSDGCAVACGRNDEGRCDIPEPESGVSYCQVRQHENRVEEEGVLRRRFRCFCSRYAARPQWSSAVRPK